jgi:hypothetical protein
MLVTGHRSAGRTYQESALLIPATDQAIRRALERAGIEFIEENGGGAGVRFKDRS